ncbi:MAG: sigma-70 family RNA polymerase sigma factor [Myxococcales bacterium]|nr:sigma-70 family RNA polymerase sigma factor [Myxococcales bacterium]
MHPQTDAEAQLATAMTRYADGDAGAFQPIWRALAGLVRARGMQWLGGREAAADDLVQQTFLKVHRNRHRYQPGAPVTPWVMTIARNLATDMLRKQGRRKEALTPEGLLPEVARPEADTFETRATAEWVRDALAQLPEGQRQVVELHKLQGQSFDEVAQRLGIQAGAARVRAHRAYARLRSLLTAPAPQSEPTAAAA